MKTKKNITGYPSIDKPWLKYYDEPCWDTATPKCSIYENILNENKYHLWDVAMMFLGKKITYKVLFKETEKVAKAFSAYGVKCDDNVIICALAMPETIYSILALNRLGANAIMINPMFTEEQLVERICETNAKILFVTSELYMRIEKIIPKTNISTIVSCSAINSFGIIIKKIKKVKEIPNTTPYKKFIKNGSKAIAPIAPYKQNRPAIMVYSSGTTGASKGIQLTNDSINNTIKEGAQIGFEWERGDCWLSQVPLWFSTGICASTLVPLKYGIKIVLEPLYDLEVIFKHIHKYKPNFMITSGSVVEFLSTEHKLDKAYKNFKFLCIGGEYISANSERKYNDWLRVNGNKHGIFKGYGMCECGGTITASARNNIVGSAGIPTPQVTISAFDIETGKELKYNERGKIRVLSPCRMLGYFNNPKETEKYFNTDNDGNVWCCTGDMGYIKEDGSVYIEGRISHSYINSSNETIYLFDVERVILDIKNVRQCKVVVSNINNRKTHVAHIAIENGTDESKIVNEIKEHCLCKLKANYVPHFLKLYDATLPVAPSRKLDVITMERNINNLIEI